MTHAPVLKTAVHADKQPFLFAGQGVGCSGRGSLAAEASRGRCHALHGKTWAGALSWRGRWGNLGALTTDGTLDATKTQSWPALRQSRAAAGFAGQGAGGELVRRQGGGGGPAHHRRHQPLGRRLPAAARGARGSRRESSPQVTLRQLACELSSLEPWGVDLRSSGSKLRCWKALRIWIVGGSASAVAKSSASAVDRFQEVQPHECVMPPFRCFPGEAAGGRRAGVHGDRRRLAVRCQPPDMSKFAAVIRPFRVVPTVSCISSMLTSM